MADLSDAGTIGNSEALFVVGRWFNRIFGIELCVYNEPRDVSSMSQATRALPRRPYMFVQLQNSCKSEILSRITAPSNVESPRSEVYPRALNLSTEAHVRTKPTYVFDVYQWLDLGRVGFYFDPDKFISASRELLGTVGTMHS